MVPDREDSMETSVLAESKSLEEVEELPKNKGNISIVVPLRKICKACKKKLDAGFKGNTCTNCLTKCGIQGNIETCSRPARKRNTGNVVKCVFGRQITAQIRLTRLGARKINTGNVVKSVFERQITSQIPKVKLGYVIPDQLSRKGIRYHSDRVTCLEFHPTNNNILVSGDWNGHLGVWDFGKEDGKKVYEDLHSSVLNNIKFSPSNDCIVYTASADGTVSCTSLETGLTLAGVNFNDDGGWKPGRMFFGMDMNAEKHALLVADNFGYLYMVDTRTNTRIGEPILIHQQGTKVVGVHCHPLQPNLILSCGTDTFARIWDIRRIEDGSIGSSIYQLKHKFSVNSAYFSPVSGSKILTTSLPNRICVWDSIFGDMDFPSREIIHIHGFNQYLTPFRAEWDPKDSSESLAVIGRLTSGKYNGVVLHPIDFIDISKGQVIAEITDPAITTISPVNKLHPRDDVLASGSSRSLFIWRPKQKIVVCDCDEGK